MQKEAPVVIGGVSYSIGDKLVGGFVVMKPQMVWLNVKILEGTLTSNAKTLKQTYGEEAYQDLRNFCSICLSKGEKIAVKTVAFKEVGEERYSYRCLCVCEAEEADRLYTFMDTIIECMGSKAKTDKLAASAALRRPPTGRVPTHASAT